MTLFYAVPSGIIRKYYHGSIRSTLYASDPKKERRQRERETTTKFNILTFERVTRLSHCVRFY